MSFAKAAMSERSAGADGFDDKEQAAGNQESVDLIEDGIHIVCVVEDMRDVDHLERSILEWNGFSHGSGCRSDPAGTMGSFDGGFDSSDLASIAYEPFEVVALTATDIEDARLHTRQAVPVIPMARATLVR